MTSLYQTRKDILSETAEKESLQLPAAHRDATQFKNSLQSTVTETDEIRSILAAQLPRLLQDISFLKSQSPKPLDIKILNQLAASLDSANIVMSNNFVKIPLYDSPSPFSIFENMQGDATLTNNLDSNIAPVTLFGFSVVSEKVTEGSHKNSIHVRLIDCLTKGAPVAFEAYVSPSDLPTFKKEFAEKISAEYRQRLPQWKATIDTITPMAHPEQYAGITYIPKVPSQKLDKLTDFKLSIAVDTAGRESTADHYVPIDIDLLNNGSLSIHGSLQSIVLSRSIPISEIKRDANDRLISINGSELYQHYIDDAGNIVSRVRSTYVGAKKGDAAFETITIKIPNQYANSKEIAVDLKSLGLDKVTFPIQQNGIPIIVKGNEQVPTFHSFEPLTSLGPKYPILIDKVKNGIQSGLQMLGQIDLSLVQHVVISQTFDENAYFARVNPSTIVVQDQVLKKHPAAALFVARHETFHLIDGTYNYSLSDGALKAFHESLLKRDDEGKSFFTKINESTVYGEFGGHAQENSRELFASLMNALSHPDYQKKLSHFSWQDKLDLHNALDALRTNLHNQKNIPESALIFLRIQEMLAGYKL